MFTRSLPSMFTIGNLFLGIIAIIFVFNDNPELAAIMVIIAMLADGLDGRVARALNVQSEFGKELDSLSDVISFGVAPAFIMYAAAFQNLQMIGWIVTAIFPICGALRLARFNVKEGVPGYFVGLPIPAAGGILSALALFSMELPPAMLAFCTLLLSFLMISNIRYPHFKKVGIPKTMLWFIPVLTVVAVLLAVRYPGSLSKLVMIPLVVYALYFSLAGIKKNIRRFLISRRKQMTDESVRSETWS